MTNDDLLPGWCIDPLNPSQMRWWDGTAWTQATEPLPPPTAAPIVPAVATAIPVATPIPVAPAAVAVAPAVVAPVAVPAAAVAVAPVVIAATATTIPRDTGNRRVRPFYYSPWFYGLLVGAVVLFLASWWTTHSVEGTDSTVPSAVITTPTPIATPTPQPSVPAGKPTPLATLKPVPLPAG